MTRGIDRLGTTADGNTVCDYDAEEIKRQISISLALAPVKYQGVKINVLDAPGNFDFAGEAVRPSGPPSAPCWSAAAKDGLSVGMERSWKYCWAKKPRMIFSTDRRGQQRLLRLPGGSAGQVRPVHRPLGGPGHGTEQEASPASSTCCITRPTSAKGGKRVAIAIPADMADEVEALRAELMEAAAEIRRGADGEVLRHGGALRRGDGPAA